MASTIDVLRRSRRAGRAVPGAWAPGRQRLETLALAVSDTAAAAGGTLAVAPARYAVLCTAFCVTAIGAAGLYRPRLTVSVLDDLPRLVFACGLALAVVFAAAPLAGWTAAGDTSDPEPAAVLAAAAVALLVARTAATGVIRAARRARPGRVTLVVGTGEPANLVIRTLLECPEAGLEPVGCVAVAPDGGAPVLPLLGKADELGGLVLDTGAEAVVVALGAAEYQDADLVAVLRACAALPCRVYLLPQFYQLHPASAAAEVVRGVPLVAVRSGRPGRIGVAAKRGLDMAAAGLALLLVSPLLLACAAAVRAEGGKGVLFKQIRVGRDGKPFTLLKFRSMKPATQTEADTAWTIGGDDRIGPVGRFLRKTSLDELPQLLNILRGDMSLIGPRPERPHFVAQFSHRHAGYGHRHRMDTGLTGLAQVNGLRGDTSIADRVLLDNHYIENWSLWLDIKIALRTAGVMFKGDR